MRIGPHELASPALMLAPMAGFTDLPFRSLCRRFGADYAVAEMTASREDLRAREKSRTRWVEPGERGLKVVQLLGADPAVMAEAARAAQADGADVVDVNMGCPAKKVLSRECGSALMKDPALAREILEAVAGAVSIPVTLKIRTGWDREHRNAVEFARMAEAAGAAMIVVHGRTRADGFKGSAEYGTIAQVRRAVAVPVVANGDVDSGAKALAVLACTGAAGLMIGRAAMGRPWIFAEVRAALEGRPYTPPAASAEGLLRVILDHRAEHFDYYDARRAMRLFRKHLAHYLKPLAATPEAEARLSALLAEEDAGAQTDRLRSFLEAHEAGTGAAAAEPPYFPAS